MEKLVYYPDGAKNSVLPIELGGTGAKTVDGAVDNLDLLTYDDVNKAGGAILLNQDGAINPEFLPSEFGNSNTQLVRALISGVLECFVNQTIEIQITNYDSFTDYTVSATKGVLARDADIITYVAGSTPGNGILTVNEASYPILIKVVGIQTPAMLAPPNETGAHSLHPVLIASSFSSTDPSDHHVSTDWQLATDINFSNLILNSVGNQSDKNQISVTTTLNEFTRYYARVRFTGMNSNQSAWSDYTSFVTGFNTIQGLEVGKYYPAFSEPYLAYASRLAMSGDGMKLAVGTPGMRSNVNIDRNDGGVDLFARSGDYFVHKGTIRAVGDAQTVGLSIPNGGSIRVTANDPTGYDAVYYQNTTVNIPAGATNITLTGKGASGVSSETVPAMNQTFTNSNGSLTIKKGISKVTVSGRGAPGEAAYTNVKLLIGSWALGVPPMGNIVNNGNDWMYARGNSSEGIFQHQFYVTTDFYTTSYTTSVGYKKGSPPSGVMRCFGYFQSTAGLISLGSFEIPLSQIEAVGGSGGNTTNINSNYYFKYTGYWLSGAVYQVFIYPAYIRTESTVAATTGAAAQFVVDGTTYTFPGATGAVTAAVTSKIITLPGTSDLTATCLTSGDRSITIKHDPYVEAIVPVSQAISGTSSIVIPAGVTEIEVSARGGNGSVATVPLYWLKVQESWEVYSGQPVGANTSNPGPSGSPAALGSTTKSYWWREQGVSVYYAQYVGHDKISTTGADSTFSINGQSYVYKGGVGRDSVPDVQIFTLPGASAITGTFTIAPTGQGVVSYIQSNNLPAATVLALSGSGTTTVPSGITTVLATGKAGTSGAASTFNINGNTYVFDSASITGQTIVLSGSTALTGTYVVPSGGALTIRYQQPTLTGAPATATVGSNNYTFAGGIGGLARTSAYGLTLGANMRLGDSIAMSGDGSTLAIGVSEARTLGIASYEAGTGTNKGFVLVYQYENGNWVHRSTITAPDGVTYDQFGKTVRISRDGNRILVLAPNKSIQGILGGGSVYLFVRTGTSTWDLEIQCVPDNPNLSNYYHRLYAGETVFPPLYEMAITNSGMKFAYVEGIYGYLSRVIVKMWGVSAWSTTIIQPPELAAENHFGRTILFSPDETELYIQSVSFPGYPAGCGVIHQYNLVGGTWVFKSRFASPYPSDQEQLGFVMQMSLDQQTLLLGAHGPLSTPPSGPVAGGSVYVYKRGAGTWNFVKRIRPTSPSTNDAFGNVVINDACDTLVVGAQYDDTYAIDSGAFYVIK